MLCIGTVNADTGRIEWAAGGPARVGTLVDRLRSLFASSGGRELTTESACGYLGVRRAEAEHALASLYLSGEVSCRHSRERYFSRGSRMVHRCYWRAREPRPKPRRKGVGA